jgi:hypothetical protein
VALDLVVKRDIDIHLLTHESALWPVARAILAQVTRLVEPCETHIHDYSSNGGLKVGVEAYPGTSGCWTIDIWVTRRAETTAFAQVDHLRQVLTPELREIIMDLKRSLIARGTYPAGSGVMVYQAVLDHGVVDLASYDAFCRARRGGDGDA